MKTTSINFRIAEIRTLTTVGFFVLSVALFPWTSASAQSKEGAAVAEAAAYTCNLGTLNGRYAAIGDGFVAAGPPPAALVPFATIGLMTFDGTGHLTNAVTRSIGGMISRGVDPGVYSINEDCTGTLTINTPAPPFTLTFDLVISELQGVKAGREFVFIATTPGGAVTATAKRIQ